MSDVDDLIEKMGWVAVPPVGGKVKADHPITVLNPTETFYVDEVRYERGTFYVRGENTCWFHINLISPA